MRTASGTPSIVPHSEEHDVYVVEHDPGPGPVWAGVDRAPGLSRSSWTF